MLKRVSKAIGVSTKSSVLAKSAEGKFDECSELWDISDRFGSSSGIDFRNYAGMLFVSPVGLEYEDITHHPML